MDTTVITAEATPVSVVIRNAGRPVASFFAPGDELRGDQHGVSLERAGAEVRSRGWLPGAWRWQGFHWVAVLAPYVPAQRPAATEVLTDRQKLAVLVHVVRERLAAAQVVSTDLLAALDGLVPGWRDQPATATDG